MQFKSAALVLLSAIPGALSAESIRLRGVALASDYDAIDFDSTANVNVFEPAEGYYDQVDEKNPLLYDTVDEEASKDEEQQGAALGLLHLSDSDNPSKGRGGALSAEELLDTVTATSFEEQVTQLLKLDVAAVNEEIRSYGLKGSGDAFVSSGTGQVQCPLLSTGKFTLDKTCICSQLPRNERSEISPAVSGESVPVYACVLPDYSSCDNHLDCGGMRCECVNADYKGPNAPLDCLEKQCIPENGSADGKQCVKGHTCASNKCALGINPASGNISSNHGKCGGATSSTSTMPAPKTGWPDGTICSGFPGNSCDNCKNTATMWWGTNGGTTIMGMNCGDEPKYPDGTYCFAGTSCDVCKNKATWWSGTNGGTTTMGMNCGNEPCWGKGTTCGTGTTCHTCCGGNDNADCPWYQIGICSCS